MGIIQVKEYLMIVQDLLRKTEKELEIYEASRVKALEIIAYIQKLKKLPGWLTRELTVALNKRDYGSVEKKINGYLNDKTDAVVVKKLNQVLVHIAHAEKSYSKSAIKARELLNELQARLIAHIKDIPLMGNEKFRLGKHDIERKDFNDVLSKVKAVIKMIYTGDYPRTIIKIDNLLKWDPNPPPKKGDNDPTKYFG